MLARAAEKFGCRPSALAGIEDPVVALDFDVAAAVRITMSENAEMEALSGQPGRSRGRDVQW